MQSHFFMYPSFSKGLNIFVDISVESVIDIYVYIHKIVWQMSGKIHFSLNDLKADMNS